MNNTLTRRSAFGLAAAPAAAAVCAIAPTPAVAAERIILMPQSVEGPYYFNPHLERRDITEGHAGVRVDLALQVVDADGGALQNARIDIWHCDAQGHYSGYQGQGDDHIDTRGQTFLRGSQFSDASGAASFRTIYPGWYKGRTAHIHYKVFLNDNTVLTAQTFLPDALSEFLYQNASAYRRADLRDTFNITDGIAQDATRLSFAQIKEEADRYVVSLKVGVDPQARNRNGAFAGGPPFSGPPPSGPPPAGANGFMPSGGPPHIGLGGAARVAALMPGAS